MLSDGFLVALYSVHGHSCKNSAAIYLMLVAQQLGNLLLSTKGKGLWS